MITAAKAQEAAEALDLELPVTQEQITKAFRIASKTCHPDVNHDPVRWERIGWAKATLEGWLALRAKINGETKPKGDCRACAGAGFIKQRGLRMMCSLCHGSGNIKRKDRDE